MEQDELREETWRSSARRVLSRATACSLIFIPFGLYMAWWHMPSGTGEGTLIWATLWGVALAMLLGALVGAIGGLVGSVVRRCCPGRRGASMAAVAEAVVFSAFALWVVLNEILCLLTYEVLGWDTFLYLLYNPKAVLEASWEMAGMYWIGVTIAMILFAVILFLLLRRLHLNDGQQHRNPSIRRTLIAGALVILVVSSSALGWQFVSGPNAVVTTLARWAPPLRAIKLPRALLGDQLFRASVNLTWGEPVISDQQFASRLPKPNPPANVVLIFLESVPAKAVGCYGRSRNVTPNIDSLAERGVVFEHCIAASSYSSYSLVSTLTSLYMLRGKGNDHFHTNNFPFMSLPRLLKLAGYQTALFSSGAEDFDNLNTFYGPSDFDLYFSHDTCDIPKWDAMRMDDHHAVTKFESWLTQRKDRRPMFCIFNLQSTHFNYQVPEPWNSHYRPVPVGYGSGNGIIYMPPELVPKIRNAYDNALRCLDHWVGRICDDLKEQGLLDNTVLVLVGDHGEGFMEHGLARHGVHLYEEFVHVPLIITAPHRFKPRRIRTTMSQIDIAPTITAMLGLPPHPSWQGKNVLAADYDGLGRPIFTLLQLARWQEVVYLDGVKYLYDLSECTDMLFDLRTDLQERDNLARSRPELRRKMQDILGQWHTRQLAYYARSNRPFTHYIATANSPVKQQRYEALHPGGSEK